MSKRKVSNDGLKFKNSLMEVAKELDCEPIQVTQTEYLTTEVRNTLTEWELRKLGGYNKLRDVFFPAEKNIVVDAVSKQLRSHRNKLETRFGKEILLKEEFLNLFQEIMKDNPVKLHKLVAPVKKTNSKIERTVVVHFSDTHYGCNIEKNEMNGSNEFNWTIAARRSAFLMDQAVTYKPQYRDQTELVILINGDIIAGVIHNQEWAVDLLTTQFAGAISILSQAISYAAQHFKKVRVICTPGNHGRAMHKSSRDRATVHKWDSYENMIYIALREMMKGKYKHVEFQIPESPFAIADIQGHKFMITHGDTVINVGNPGKSIDMKVINDQINKANSQLLPDGHNFAAIMVGHVHIPTIQLTDSGTMLLINGTLSGQDQFAQSIGVFSNHPTQTIFEVVPGHAVGDMRIIRLKDADSDKRMDAIIEPFMGKF